MSILKKIFNIFKKILPINFLKKLVKSLIKILVVEIFRRVKNFFLKLKTQREFAKKGLVGGKRRLALAQKESLKSKAEKSRLLAVFIACSVWITAVLTLIFPPAKHFFFSLVENQISPYTVYADFNFSYEDPIATEKKKENALKELPIIYRIDKRLTDENIKRFKLLVQKLNEFLKKSRLSEKNNSSQKGKNSEALASPAEGNQEKTPSFSETPFTLTENSDEKFITNFINSLSSSQINVLKMVISTHFVKQELIDELKKYLYRGIISPDEKASHKFGQKIRIEDIYQRLRYPQELAEIITPEEAALSIADKISRLYSPVDRKNFKNTISFVMKKILHGNLVYDKFLSKKIKKESINNIKPVIVHIRKGEIIIAKGEKVSKSDIIRFDNYLTRAREIEREKHFMRKVFQKIIICLILVLITGLYIYHIHPEIIKSNQKMGLTGTVIIISFIAMYGVIKLFDIISINFNFSPNLIFLVLPIAIGPIILSVLVGMRAAFYTGVLISLHTAMQLNLNDSFIVILGGTAVSCIGAFAVRYSTNYRMYLFRAIFSVFVVTLIVYFSQYWGRFYLLSSIVIAIELALVNAVITGSAALLLLLILEPLFQISSDMSLLLLCDFNHPLLKKLQMKAPGSYHHSLMVAALAEQAAVEIKANPIKARACALFHDIGKLSHPEYFIENNYGGRSKHSELSPKMSSLIILNHVKEGIDLAIQYKLRKIIRDAIEQHHGNDLVTFFYKQALEESASKGVTVNEEDYRYSGSPPREKEVVLVSLADACEAASRSLEKPSHSKIEALVWEIFRKRIREHQLDYADLTFRELAIVRNSFVKTITTMYHTRISYPKDETDEEDDLFSAAEKISRPGQKSVGENNQQKH